MINSSPKLFFMHKSRATAHAEHDHTQSLIFSTYMYLVHGVMASNSEAVDGVSGCYGDPDVLKVAVLKELNPKIKVTFRKCKNN